MPSSAPARRYYAVASKLSTLPPELVHKVLSDLPVSKILELITAHNIPYVDTCVLTHLDLRRILTSASSLSTLKEFFAIYMELCQRREGRHSSAHPFIPSLERDAAYLVNQPGNPSQRYIEILATVKVATLTLLDAYITYFPVLSKFAAEPIPSREYWDTSNPTSLWKLWKNIDNAEYTMNGIKSAQLQRIAKMLLEYPDMLRSSTFHSQEPCSHALQHQVDRFRRDAKKILKPQFLRNSFVASRIFMRPRFPVVPYDQYLRYFLKVLKKFPVDTVPAPYPPDVTKAITTTVEGLAYVYLKETVSYPEHRILRTRFTIHSANGCRSSRGQSQPCFVDADVDDPITNMYSLSNIHGLLPLAEREFEWIEAFLKSCTFMSKMDMEWKKGMPEKEYWTLYVGRTTAPTRTAGHKR